MKRRDFILATILLLLIGLITPMGRELVAQTSYSIQGWLAHVTDETNDALQVNIVAQSGAVAASSITNSGDTTLTGDLAVGGWPSYAPAISTAQSYTISSSGKAMVYIREHTDTAVCDTTLPTTPTDGTYLIIVDGDLNAGTNNHTLYPGGSDTINEGSSFVQNANGESTHLLYNSDGTDWQIIGGYLE